MILHKPFYISDCFYLLISDCYYISIHTISLLFLMPLLNKNSHLLSTISCLFGFPYWYFTFTYRCSSEPDVYFLHESDIENSAIEKILRNKFYDPLLSSESEDETRPKVVLNWDEIFNKKANVSTRLADYFPTGYYNVLVIIFMLIANFIDFQILMHFKLWIIY